MGGPAEDSVRRCLATGARLPRPRMVRFVVDPEGNLAPDILCRLPGRGMWVTADRAVLERACSRSMFNRHARQQVRIDPGLPTRIEKLLAGRVIDLLSMSRKCGIAVAGFEKVRELVRSGRACLVLHASDGSESQIGKLARPGEFSAAADCLTAQELGVAFGRRSVVHAALKPGPLAQNVLGECRRLSGFRSVGRSDLAGSAM